MKKVLVLLVLCSFSACSAAATSEEILQKTQEQLSQGCEFSLELRGESEATATLRWSAGEQELCFTAPEDVEGLCYVRDGGGLTVSFEGISAKISEAALPQGAALSELYEALDALLVVDPETLSCEIEADGLLKVSPRNSQRRDARGAKTATEILQNTESMPRNSQRGLPAVWIDVESCLPIAIKTEHWDVALALHSAL